MAELLASGLVDFVLGKLGDILVQQIVKESALVFNFTKDFRWLKKKLTVLRDSLQYASGHSTQVQFVNEWIQEVRDIAFDAEDIIEEYGVQSLYSSRHLVFRYKMGRKIRKIKDRIRSVIEDAAEIKILREEMRVSQGAAQASSSSSQREVWTRSSVPEWDARPVAVNDKVEEIVSLLDKPDVSVIAVVGMGGVGKTFLMQQVYKKVQNMFEKYVWLSISQMYSVKQLQCDLASQIGGLQSVDSGISSSEAERLIHSSLEGKKFLIVLDDVWKPFQEEDDLIRRLGLPFENNSSCKIVVTTRNRQIFSNMNNVSVYEYKIRPLAEKDSWQLFCVYAFSDCTPPPYLEKLSHEIERECAGLPLAIKTVASSMANTRSPRDWELKLSQLKKVMAVNPVDPIMKIIKLSYDLLLPALKSCFAYLSFFPEDHEIDCEYLIYLWAAEGFINEDELEIGWDYLNRLANLCLIELWEEEIIDDGYFYVYRKKCKVHDLVLDFAVHTSRDNKCAFAVEVFEKGKSGCRRMLLAKKGIDNNAIIDSNFLSARCVRTLSLFNNSIGDNVSANLFSHLRVLRVLDLSRTSISTLPECVGNLKLLRVLNLSRTDIEQVPDCVAKLKSLRFLDVSDCKDLVEVPEWIGELTCLQHLRIYECSEQLKNIIYPKGISKLLSLRTLGSYLKLSIEETESNLLKLEDLDNLTELLDLRIQVNHEVQRRKLGDGILERLVNMRHLAMVNLEIQINEVDGQMTNLPEMANLPETMKAMKDLESLFLVTFSLPGWISAYVNLKVLDLMYCECSDYSALSLETMPNLMTLYLRGDNRCRELPKGFGKSGAFPKLRKLRILHFIVLEELWEEVEDGAMSGLEELYVGSCPKIKNLPQGLERLKSLHMLPFYDSGTEEVRQRLKEGGEVWSEIKAHNPDVAIYVY